MADTQKDRVEKAIEERLIKALDEKMDSKARDELRKNIDTVRDLAADK